MLSLNVLAESVDIDNRCWKIFILHNNYKFKKGT